MGKKRIIKQSEDELIKEREKVEEKAKEADVKTTVKVKEGRIYIFSSYNNTIISLTDSQGNVLASKSAGSIGFKGTKKSTSFAASKVAEAICMVVKKLGMGNLNVFVKGIGAGRDSAIRSLVTHGLDIVSVTDITPIPHNGCRPKKVRRV